MMSSFVFSECLAATGSYRLRQHGTLLLLSVLFRPRRTKKEPTGIENPLCIIFRPVGEK